MLASSSATCRCALRPANESQRTCHPLNLISTNSLYTSASLKGQGPAARPLLLRKGLVSQRHSLQQVQATNSDRDDPPVEYSKQFGYSRKDVILVGVGLLVAGVLLYNGLQALGIPAIRAGNYVQIIFVLGLCIAWVASYVFRVANKDMTYVKQLQTYEEQVMQKRLDEMPESEKERMLEEITAERQRREKKRMEKEKLEKR